MPSSLRILLVEDHDVLRKSTERMLVSRGLAVQSVECAEDVDDLPEGSGVDLYIIDLNLPGEDGLQLARRLRRAHPQCGIIMFTARTELDDRIAGYENGADIYLCKPVDPNELVSAIAALAHRIGTYRRQPFLRLIRQAGEISNPSGKCRLTPHECALLTALSRANDNILERWQVAVHLGLDDDTSKSNTLNARMSKLRTKIINAGIPEPAIIPIRAIGYKLCFDLEVL